jgi:hypothetical protein
MSVLSHSNMQILWEVLDGMISDNKLNINDLEGFRGYFDNKCKEYHVKRFDYNGLSDINKHIIGECFGVLKKASQDSKLLMFKEYEKYGNKNVVDNLQIGKRYEEHQSNFKTMINAKKPNEVEFGENSDEPIGNMDDIISKRMAEREKDMNTIKNEYDKNQDSIKWLNSSGDIPPKLVIHDFKPDAQPGQQYAPQTGSQTQQYQAPKQEPKQEKKKVKFKSDLLSQKKFQKLQNDMNKADAENSKIYLKKREIVRMDETEPVKNETNLMDVFTKMKKKTDTSDIEGSQRIDIIDINKKVDKLETYIVDILKNQIDLMSQQKEILAKLQ